MSQSDESIHHDSLVLTLKQRLPFLILIAILGAAVAFGLAKLTPTQWTASLTLQVGQVGDVKGAQIVENPLATAWRLSLPAFKQSILDDMAKQGQSVSADERKLVIDTLRATARPGTALVDVQVSGYSREQALRTLDTAFRQTRVLHQAKAEPLIDTLKSELSTVDGQIELMTRQWNETFARLHDAPAKPQAEVVMGDALASIAASSLTGRISQLKEWQSNLTRALSPLNTFDTSIMVAANVPEEPSAPRTVLYTASGLALGLLLGIFIALMRGPVGGRRVRQPGL